MKANTAGSPPLTSGHYDPCQDFVTGVRGRATTVHQLRVFLSHQVEDGLCEELQKKKCRLLFPLCDFFFYGLDHLDRKFPKPESSVDFLTILTQNFQKPKKAKTIFSSIIAPLLTRNIDDIGFLFHT